MLNKIHIYPDGGIGNRMRVINSAYNLSLKTSSPLVVHWERDDTLNAFFWEVFEESSFYEVVDVKMGTFRKLSRKLLKMMTSFFKGRFYIRGMLYLDGCRNLNDVLGEVDCRDVRELHIRTCHGFYEVSNMYVDLFHPIKEIVERCNATMRVFSTKPIGIHIRRSDNVESIEHSPRELFVDVLDSLTDEYEKFYFTSDSDEEVSYFKSKYRESIVIREKTLKRNTVDGIRDAVIDIYCLSGCKKIYGSYYSSFSEVASALGNAPLCILKKEI